ncbi:hypothetical protein G7Y89_g299 [Cudoniella acicularis]|uniref:Uncharacterized protein n=1 Tax=Cudoniella acicularis TaxID=354080 RepID=A0A8H4RZ36_9HELO|nr:hypothetical protein G7Y89_g299 [Cudoniella acicularis]
MASTVSSIKVLQENRRLRPAVPKTIVPAIPLTYVQKRQKQQAARAKAKEEEAPPTPITPVLEEPAPEAPVAEIEPVATNGSPDIQVHEQTEENDEFVQASAPDTPSLEEEIVETVAEEPEVIAPEESLAELRIEQHETPRSAPSEAQSSASRSTFHMPPAFVPASQNHHSSISTDSVKFPAQNNFNGQPPMHHAHPSAGNVMFGGYPDSNASSPAPPPSAGNVPPYPYQQQPMHGGGRHGHQQSNGGHSQMSNGYSPMGPPPGYYPRPDMNQGPGPDSYARRQMVAFGPPDGYSPTATPLGADGHRLNAYDPSTPRSFHGSQSSAPNDQENGPAFYSQYPTAVISNGSNGHIDEVRLYQQPRPKPRTGSQALAPVPNAFPPQAPSQPPMSIDHLDGLMNYLQLQFADPTLADYTLELRYADDRAAPVRIPGHNIMFARSPTLKALIMEHAQDSNRDGVAARTLLIESDDRFLRSDAFWMAMQRLYGGPLLDLGALAGMSSFPNMHMTAPMPGIPADRFDLALGYAAAGNILQIPPVIARGVEIAGHFVSWPTLEKALDFALDGGLDSQWTLANNHESGRSPSTYGPAVNMLIHQALNFIIPAFPPNFDLDVSVGEFMRSRRLPALVEERPSAPNPRLSFIKFGDHPTEESVRSTTSGSEIVTLSKVLLNLPFHLLKYVLESPRLGNVQGWATTALRQKVMHAVIEEREKRRLNVYRNSHLTNSERKMNHHIWEAVGWQESVEPLGGNEITPTLTRTWVDYVLPTQN